MHLFLQKLDDFIKVLLLTFGKYFEVPLPKQHLAFTAERAGLTFVKFILQLPFEQPACIGDAAKEIKLITVKHNCLKFNMVFPTYNVNKITLTSTNNNWGIKFCKCLKK